MPRPDVYGGFATVKLGNITHDFIKREAKARHMSIHEFILAATERYTGHKLELIPDTATPSNLRAINNYLKSVVDKMDAGFEKFVNPKGKPKRSVEADVSWIFQKLGIDFNDDDVDKLITEIKSKIKRIEQYRQTKLKENVV